MKKILLFTLVVILIPFLIIGISSNKKIVNKIKFGIYSNKIVKVKRTFNGEIQKIPLEEYVVGVVAGEMPASFNIEALKAQAVASRTYVLKRLNNKNEYDVLDASSNQAYIDDKQQKEKWKNNYEKYLKKIKEAVTSTKGEVVLYENNIIDAMFFSTSNGYTENSGDVFTNDLPYLKSVTSSWDEKESPVFSSSSEISKSEFLFNLGINENYEVNITNVEKSNTGRVKSITINDKIFKGTKIREIFNLKSTSFDVIVNNDTVSFKVKGYGHGVGMSQYGANGMAKEGYNYKDILMYYYKNCEIKKIN